MFAKLLHHQPSGLNSHIIVEFIGTDRFAGIRNAAPMGDH
jgi:hypothetical protein